MRLWPIEASRNAEEIIVWAQRKHEQLKRNDESHITLDRLPTSTGPDPELWIQVDFKNPDAIAYTISINASGRVAIQFQYMKSPPFDEIKGKKALLKQINSLEGIAVEDRFNGRPSFQLDLLSTNNNLEKFILILENTVDELIKHTSSK